MVGSSVGVKVGVVVVSGLVAAFAVSDALIAHGSHEGMPAAVVEVRVGACDIDSATHVADAVGTVFNATRSSVATYRFSVAFTDVAGDEQNEPVVVGVLPAGGRVPFRVRSSSLFPSRGLRCALANLNPPGDL